MVATRSQTLGTGRNPETNSDCNNSTDIDTINQQIQEKTNQIKDIEIERNKLKDARYALFIKQQPIYYTRQHSPCDAYHCQYTRGIYLDDPDPERKITRGYGDGIDWLIQVISKDMKDLKRWQVDEYYEKQ